MTDSGGMRDAVGAAGSVTASAAPSAPATASTPTKATSRWTSVVAKRVSGKWISGAFTALVLAATAAFGGLAAVPTPPIPELAAGEGFVGAELEMTPQRAVLIDEEPATGAYPKAGERLIVVILDVTNLDEEPRKHSSEGSVAYVRLDAFPDVAPSVARYDDTTSSPWLQPGVPATLVLAWAVPADAYADGDEIRIHLPTATEYVGQSVIHGEYWDDATVGAYATLIAEDVGAGVEA